MRQGWNEAAHSHLRLHGHKSGGKRSRTYIAWVNMKGRCGNTGRPDYQHWGGRGIKHDSSWSDFRVFLQDMGECPEGMTLDRIDNGGPYCKSNCRWASMLEQGSNKRNNHWIEYQGRSKTLSQWSRELDIGLQTLLKRLQRGMTPSEAFTMPKWRKAHAWRREATH